MVFNIFDKAIPTETLSHGDPEIHQYLNYNPSLVNYTSSDIQLSLGRDPSETDRGGWRGYFRVYSKYFSALKNKPIKILEVGTHFGWGLLAWARYFPNAEVYGVDNVVRETRLNNINRIRKNWPEFSKVTTEYFDSTKSEDWSCFEQKQFDVIIDDGGHHPDTQIQTLENGFKLLKPGGLYFIEDISHRYSEDSLKKLDDKLSELKPHVQSMKVYSHVNNGLYVRLIDKRLRENSMDIHPDANNDATEYIVAIVK